jgi:hypothetical protein
MSKKYDVGYKKPPAHSRWKPGQSGNLSGRSKKKVKVLDGAAIFRLVAGANLAVNDNGKKRNITKLEGFITKTMNDAIKGNQAAAKMIFSYLSKLPAQAEPAPHGAEETDAETAKKLNIFFDEMAANLSKGTGAVGPHNDNSEKSSGPVPPDKNPPKKDG